jgi:phosphatidylserine decarboxylase
MGTRSGFAVFQDPEVNKHLKRILDAWGEYLQSPASGHCLGTDKNGWFGEHARAQLEKVANLGQTPEKRFEELFECDPQVLCPFRVMGVVI